MDDRGEDQLHGEAHLAAVHNDRGGARHERVVDHVQQVGEVDPPLLTGTLTEVMITKLSSGVGMFRILKGLDVSTVGTRWKLMSVWLN